jgi:prevent-host-death family protein
LSHFSYIGGNAPPRTTMKPRTRPLATREPSVSYTATEAKNRFGEILHGVASGGAALVTSRNRPRAVILAYEDYVRLIEQGSRSLDLLTEEFDALFASQQTAAARAGMKRAFASTPERMGKVAAARKAR